MTQQDCERPSHVWARACFSAVMCEQEIHKLRSLCSRFDWQTLAGVRSRSWPRQVVCARRCRRPLVVEPEKAGEDRCVEAWTWKPWNLRESLSTITQGTVAQSEHKPDRRREQARRLIAAWCHHPQTALINRLVCEALEGKAVSFFLLLARRAAIGHTLTLSYPDGEALWRQRTAYKVREYELLIKRRKRKRPPPPSERVHWGNKSEFVTFF